MIHILLVVFVTFQILLLISTSAGYSRSQLAVFYKIFFDPGIDVSLVNFETNKYFYNINEALEFINKWVDTYYNLEKSDSFEKYTLPKFYNSTSMKEEDIAVNLEVFYRMKHNRNDYQNVSYSITNEYRGPFAYKSEDFRAFVSNSTHFHLV